MVAREQVLEALKDIVDPVTGQSIVEHHFIRDIVAKEDRVSLTVVTASEQEQHRFQLEREIRELLSQSGVKDIHIRFRAMSERERLEAGLGHQAATEHNQQHTEPPTQPQGHGAGLESNSLLTSDTKFIAIASGKGGVGKSTVTVNIAAALARQGCKVGIIDADIYGFSIPDMMGIEERPQIVDDRVIPIERFGVKVISMGFFVEDNAPIVWRGPMLGKMLRNFFQEVNWGDLDYMLLDLPPGTGDIALDVHQMLPQSQEIIVTTPHATAAFVAARAGTMAIHTKHEIIGVIENMAYYECSDCGQKDYVFGRGGGARLAESLNCDLLAQIPLGAPDNHPSEADFSPSVYKDSTPTGQIYNDIAQQIIRKYE
ncbi:MRP family ATP-binding protein [Paenibacillus selenitireducens]|uniref:Iron-sulfur cluster carrier protein n=1 Tax=Paenibacillus selenitireducens TaxID=1324314 RepID=A0A1T2WZQ2_9BACL|nr:Mrp/NBP35 family ATP-binding protein [Paenibacillus selenitireducens]OPA73082.1 MRP family ATP-binding protein [Paenibacillus selenitireducens]